MRRWASLVIAAGRGLVPPETVVTLEELSRIAAVPIDPADLRYREPLERAARTLAENAGPGCDAVLLGSVATANYIEPLLEIFGDRLLFPAELVGRGDMSRGGLLLRCACLGAELAYTPACRALRHGPRPPRLPKFRAPGLEETNA